jgi:hypothetical protein
MKNFLCNINRYANGGFGVKVNPVFLPLFIAARSEAVFRS